MLERLRRQLAADQQRLRALLNITDRDLTAEERAEYDRLSGDSADGIPAQRARISSAEELEESADLMEAERSTAVGRDQRAAASRRETGQTATGRGGHAPEGRRGAALAREERVQDWSRAAGQVPEGHEELSFGRYMRGMVTGDWRDADLERRAMAEGTATAGGYAVPTVLASGLIDLARNQTRVLQAGAQLVPMAHAFIDLAKWTGDPSAAWHTEAATITATDATLGRVQLRAKTLAALVVVSRELIEDAEAFSVDAALQDAFAAQFALTVDTAALYGSGASGQPLGVKNTSGVTVGPLATNGQTPTSWDWAVNAAYAVRAANETPTGMIWSPRTGKTHALLKDTTGQPLQVPGYLDGIARYETNQVPNTLTVGTATGTTSDAFIADWSQLLVGVRPSGLSVQVLDQRYADTGQVGFLAWWRGDVAVARASAFYVATGILP